MTSLESQLIETDPPSGVKWRHAWEFFWRSFLCMIPVYIGQYFVGGNNLYLTQYSGNPSVAHEMDGTKFLLALVSFVYSVVVICFILKSLLGKKFGDYKLVLMTPADSPPQTPPTAENPPAGVLLGMMWGFTWRSILWYIPFILGLVLVVVTLSVALVVLRPDPAIAGLIGICVGGTFGLGVGFWIIKKVLSQLMGKKFGGYRLVYLTPQGIAAAEQIASADSVLSATAPPPSSGTL